MKKVSKQTFMRWSIGKQLAYIKFHKGQEAADKFERAYDAIQAFGDPEKMKAVDEKWNN